MTLWSLRPWALVAVLSPLWLGACGPPLPPLELKSGTSPGGDMPFPTQTPVFVDVVAMGRSSQGCGGDATFNPLTLLEANCGEGCSVENVAEEPEVHVRLALTATTPGLKTLDVTVQDAVEGTRSVTAEYEFLDVSQLLVTHTGASDPGLVWPMLIGLEPEWCVGARAADGRDLEIQTSPIDLVSLNESFTIESMSSYGEGRCWQMRAAASGTGHLRLNAAGQERDYFPVAVSGEEIAEVHLHGVIQTTDDYRIPLDQEAYWEGPEQEYIIPTVTDFPLDLIVRLVTTDGRKARGGVNRFTVDTSVPHVWWIGSNEDAQILGLSTRGVAAPPATCVRATIGAGSVALPVYIDTMPGDVPDPCLFPEGTGGMGGAGGAAP